MKAEKTWSWMEEGTNSRRKKADAAAEVAAESMRVFVLVLEELVPALLVPEEAIFRNLSCERGGCNRTIMKHEK